MDRADYYRVLGVQPGASRAQIDRAYGERMKRLKSSDYADEREYADRKMRELKYAYSVVAGGAAPISERQKLAHHERRKDDMEIAETADSFFGNLSGQVKAAAGRVKQSADALSHPEGSHSHRNDKAGGAYQSGSQSRSRKSTGGQRLVNDVEGARKGGQPLVKSFDMSADGGKALKTVVGIIVVLLAIIPSMISSCESDRYPDYGITIGEPEEVSAEDVYYNTVYEADQLMTNKVSDYDYDGWLDYSEVAQNQDTVIDDMVYLPEDDETYTQLLAMKLGLDSAEAAVTYLSDGDDEAYWQNTDYENACLLGSALMDAPSFEEIAGCLSLYSGEPIIDHGTYLQFLVDVANSQTFSVLYG